MQNQEVSKQIQRLRDLFTKTSEACGGNIEIQAHWAKYLCIRAAGLLENALPEIYSSFVAGAAPTPIANFAGKQLDKIQNPKTPKFIEVARSFKPVWGDELQQFVDDNGRREAIDSIMSNRHRIAHGEDSGITVVQVKGYLDKAVEVLEFVEQQCKA